MRGLKFKRIPRNSKITVRVVLVILVGLVALRLTHASAPTASFEAENGSSSATNGGQASHITSSGASNSAAIRFGLAPVNPSNYITRWSSVAPFANPIHFIDNYYNPPKPFTRVEVDTNIEVAGGSDGYYFANQINFPDTPSCTPSCIAYMGLQTVGGRSLPPGGSVDKMVIFSVWNSTNSLPAPGVTSVDFGGEGVGKSLRVAYDWQVGHTYRMEMYYDYNISNSTTGYWAADVVDTTNNTSVYLGDIQMTSGVVAAQSGGVFHERYGGPVNSCSDMNPSQVKFSNFRAFMPNPPGGWINKSIDAWAIYQANVTGCNAYFWTKDLPGAAFRSGVNTPAQ